MTTSTPSKTLNAPSSTLKAGPFAAHALQLGRSVKYQPVCLVIHRTDGETIPLSDVPEGWDYLPEGFLGIEEETAISYQAATPTSRSACLRIAEAVILSLLPEADREAIRAAARKSAKMAAIESAERQLSLLRAELSSM